MVKLLGSEWLYVTQKNAKTNTNTIGFSLYLSHDEKLNTTFSVTDFGLDDGEQLLREMQDMRESLAQFNGTVDELISRSKTVVPLKQRRQTLRQPTAVTAICNYKKMDVSKEKCEITLSCLLFMGTASSRTFTSCQILDVSF